MLRLHRHNKQQTKPGEKLDFKFSGFKAIQVPKSWDRLVLSLVSVETGKTVAKTSRATVRNGSCQWSEAFAESVRVSDEDETPSSTLFKLIVSMGSSRSGVLGEAAIDAADYASSGDCAPVSLKLKKCSHGTTLQVKVQCLNPRSKSRNESNHKISDSEKPNDNYQDSDLNSDESGSSSAKYCQLNSDSGDLGSRETSFSLSESHKSYDSAEGSISCEESLCSTEIHHPKNASFDSQITASENQPENNHRQDFSSSGATIEELRVEAKMWERNARKLMLDLDSSKSELSEIRAERDSLKDEIGRLRSHELNAELKEAAERQKMEMKDLQELRESEKNLNSRVKLLEQALEEKNQQIEKGKVLNGTFLDVENEYKSRLFDKEEEIVDLKAQLSEVEELKEKVQELERDCNELTEENLELLLKLKEAKNEPAMTTSVEFPHRKSFEFQLSERQFPSEFSEESLEKKRNMAEMEDELTESRRGMEKLLVSLRSKEEDILVLGQCRTELEAKVSDLQREKAQIQENLEVVLQESEATSKCLNELQNDLAVLTSSVDSNSSDNKVGNSFELERENTQLSILVESLESQLESSRSRSTSLSEELDRLKNEMQSTFDSFILECDFLRKSNGELEGKLEEAYRSLSDCLKKVDELEGYLSSITAEFELRERSLALQLDKLLDENLRREEKVDRETNLLNQIYIERVVEADKLRDEAESLTKKLSESDEKLAKLESDFRETQSRLKNKEIDFDIKLKMLTSKLADSNQERENMLSLVDKHKSGEAMLNTRISDLELKLADSEYQSEQVCEERDEVRKEKNELVEKITSLTAKLLKMDDDLAEIDEIRNQNKLYRMRIEELQEERDGKQNAKKASNLSKTNGKNGFTGDESLEEESRRADIGSKMKVQSLQDQLANALEENSKYKAHLDKLVLENMTVHSDVLRRSSTSDGEIMSKSILEAELRELRERYSMMSLKYAEVEAQREELVMKLRTTSRNSSKRWFS